MRMKANSCHTCGSRSHLCRESREVPATGTGLTADGVGLTQEQGSCPAGAGDIMVSGVSISAPPPPSKNTSLAPANPGHITKDGRGGGVNNPGTLEDEPLPPAAGSAGWASAPWLFAGGETPAAAASLSLSRRSSAGFCSAFPSLS